MSHLTWLTGPVMRISLICDDHILWVVDRIIRPLERQVDVRKYED